MLEVDAKACRDRDHAASAIEMRGRAKQKKARGLLDTANMSAQWLFGKIWNRRVVTELGDG